MALTRKRILYLGLLVWIGVASSSCQEQSSVPHLEESEKVTPVVQKGPAAIQNEQLTPGLIEKAFREQKGNLIVSDTGHVIKILPDDTKGSRHQRFIIKLASGQTVLVAHNIDLAPRVDGLRKGDRILFRGEYEWNQKGGVIHWTHHDPRKRHPGGWIRHKGRLYE